MARAYEHGLKGTTAGHGLSDGSGGIISFRKADGTKINPSSPFRHQERANPMTLRTRALVASALLAALAAPAFAGGFAPAQGEPGIAAPVAVPVAAPAADWSGVSVGVNLAFGKLGFEQADAEDEFDGAVYGVQAAYARDIGKFVVGAEVAYDWVELDAEDEDAQDLGTAADLKTSLRAGATLGYDMGRVLPFAAAGLSRASFAEDLVPGKDTFNGAYYGVGVDHALSDSIVLGAEVLHHDFDTDVDGLENGLNTFGVSASFKF